MGTKGSFISDTQGWITAGNLAPVFPNPSPSRIQLSETYYLGLIYFTSII